MRSLSQKLGQWVCLSCSFVSSLHEKMDENGHVLGFEHPVHRQGLFTVMFSVLEWSLSKDAFR